MCGPLSTTSDRPFFVSKSPSLQQFIFFTFLFYIHILYFIIFYIFIFHSILFLVSKSPSLQQFIFLYIYPTPRIALFVGSLVRSFVRPLVTKFQQNFSTRYLGNEKSYRRSAGVKTTGFSRAFWIFQKI